MISRVLTALENGLRTMRLNTRFMLVGVLVFVFPLAFIWITESFFSASYENIHTVQKQRVGMAHDTVTALLLNAESDRQLLTSVIKKVKTNNEDVSKFRVYLQTPNGLLVVAAADDALIGNYDPTAEEIKKLGFSNVLDFQLLEFLIDGNRVWQAYKWVPVASNDYYIFTELDLSRVDRTMSYRRQQSYFGLTGIFIFLLALAYWLRKQVDWKAKHEHLSELMHERDLFSNMIAHEFRSPLTAIKGYASFLEESQNLPPDERRFAGNIHKSAQGLIALVSDFLEVARLQSGTLKLNLETVDVRTLVANILENMQSLAQEKGLALEFEEPSAPLELHTDPARLSQVLTNIISNAIKYTNHGSVKLRCDSDYNTVSIRVMDTGMGISAEDQKKLFTPFMRVGGVDNAKITGTGLGMYITKQLVGILHGTIGIESIKGVGSHVVITIKTK